MRNLAWFVLLLLAGVSTAWADSRYVIEGSEVYDAKTKLTWARCSVGQEWKDDHCWGTIGRFTFEEAQHQGGNGWRVPTKDELFTLVDPDKKSFPTIDTKAFPDMDVLFRWYWSSTASGDSTAWYVDFTDGFTSGFIDSSTPFSVRLVRGPK
jgi:hypothetical protein